jgi:hypothetical protein
VADEPRDLIALVRPRRRQIGPEKRVPEEADRDDRQYPAGGTPHGFQHQHDQQDAECDVPVVRQDRAVEKVVAAGDEIRRGRDAADRQSPVPPPHAVPEALGQRKDEESEQQHEGDVGRAQVLGAHDGVGGIEMKQRHHHRYSGHERGEPAGELVVHTLLALDHGLGALERLPAHLGGGLVDADDFFAHRSPPKRKSPASGLDGASFGARRLS